MDDSATGDLCPMCAHVGYPVMECRPCSKAVYCDKGQHSSDNGSPCRICDLPLADFPPAADAPAAPSASPIPTTENRNEDEVATGGRVCRYNVWGVCLTHGNHCPDCRCGDWRCNGPHCVAAQKSPAADSSAAAPIPEPPATDRDVAIEAVTAALDHYEWLDGDTPERAAVAVNALQAAGFSLSQSAHLSRSALLLAAPVTCPGLPKQAKGTTMNESATGRAIDPSLLHGTADAMVWAETFDQVRDARLAEDGFDIASDVGTMIGWFANAMFAAESAAAESGSRSTDNERHDDE